MPFSRGTFFKISTCPFGKRSVFVIFDRYLVDICQYLSMYIPTYYMSIYGYIDTPTPPHPKTKEWSSFPPQHWYCTCKLSDVGEESLRGPSPTSLQWHNQCGWVGPRPATPTTNLIMLLVGGRVRECWPWPTATNTPYYHHF